MWRQTISRIINGASQAGKTIANRELSAVTPTLNGRNGNKNCNDSLAKKALGIQSPDNKKQPCPDQSKKSPCVDKKKKSPCAGVITHENSLAKKSPCAEKQSKSPCPPAKDPCRKNIPANPRKAQTPASPSSTKAPCPPRQTPATPCPPQNTPASPCPPTKQPAGPYPSSKQPANPRTGAHPDQPSKPCPPGETSPCIEMSDHSGEPRNDHAEKSAHHNDLVPPMSILCQLKGFELKSNCTSFHMLSSGFE